MDPSKIKLRGIVTPLVTPLRHAAALDVESLSRLIERVVEGGVHGLFVLGSTGESPSLSIGLRCAVITTVRQLVEDRVPILVNVSDTAFAHCLRLAEEAALAGASAVALSPPCYFPLDQEQLFRYTKRFCENSPLPVFIYNVPQYAHNAFTPETVGELSYLPNVIGLKNSNGSLEYLEAVRDRVAHRDDFSLFVGNEEILLSALAAGADGGVCGGANMFPKLFVQLYEAATNGCHEEAEPMQELVARIAKAVYTVGPPEGSYLRGLKHALSMLGVIENVLAEPLQNFNPEERAELENRFGHLMEQWQS
ncbi:MAG TPA: dihydrodipicolinate synthase family protein [Bryobacteraceae bacterium]|nr:dihydrodipicolinate synthase family protein [Bryobacteraceae bacterium]